MEAARQLDRFLDGGTYSLDGLEKTLLAEMIREWSRQNVTQLPQLYLAALLLKLSAVKAARKRAGESRVLEEMEAKLLTRINGYVLQELNRGHALTVKELSQNMGISESQLRIKFHRLTQLSLGQHLRDLQMRRAVSLLQSPATSITEVAERCGFASVYSFSRAFKAAWKMSPRAYRKSMEIG